MPPEQYELSKHHCLEITVLEMYALICAQVPEVERRKFIGRGALPHVSLKPVQKRSFLHQRFLSPAVDCWAKICTLLT